MIHIWLDESDKHGTYYSNFYGGILVESRHREIVLQRMEAVKLKANIIDEIKWQKVNAYHFDKYIQLVDELFEMGKEGLLKIRIFFRHNQYEPELTPQKGKSNTQFYTISSLNTLLVSFLPMIKKEFAST